MRGRVNAAREAADDHDAGARQIERNFVGRDRAFLGRRARADHRDAVCSERAAIAADPETFGRIGDLRQQRRIVRSAEIDAVHAEIPADCP